MMWSSGKQTDAERARVRSAAVAGRFYPQDPRELSAEVEAHLAAARAQPMGVPKAAIAPHAGYMFSGPIAGSVYACLAAGRDTIRRVVLLGPAHHAVFPGLAASSAEAFASPLGLVPIDEEALAAIRSLPQVTTLDAAHAEEHSLEVQLPFLQKVFSEFKLVPLLVGDAAPSEVSEVIEKLWGGGETCVIVSSDLSHYREYPAAQEMDRAAAKAVETMDGRRLSGEMACGCRPIRGLLLAAKAHGLHCHTVDLRNSGDTSGRRDRVVGYGGFIFTVD
jgi:MEMO1 family protein